jgi:hypothetical protein
MTASYPRGTYGCLELYPFYDLTFACFSPINQHDRLQESVQHLEQEQNYETDEIGVITIHITSR